MAAESELRKNSHGKYNQRLYQSDLRQFLLENLWLFILGWIAVVLTCVSIALAAGWLR